MDAAIIGLALISFSMFWISSQPQFRKMQRKRVGNEYVEEVTYGGLGTLFFVMGYLFMMGTLASMENLAKGEALYGVQGIMSAFYIGSMGVLILLIGLVIINTFSKVVFGGGRAP